MPSTCHPYARVSDSKQPGLIRQTSAETQRHIEQFCAMHSLKASARVRVDDGVSAFRGLHATPSHELGRFLADAKRGDVRPGDCLLIENYDRLSRQDPWAAIGLVNDLRQMKVHVGRLDRMKLLRYDSNDPGDFFEAAVEFSRGNSESAMKSYRNGAAWRRKREEARAGKPMRALLPSWVRWKNGVKGGELELVPERAAVLRHVFELAIAGLGYARICRKLSQEALPPPGRAGWVAPTIKRWLNDKRAIGEMQLYGPGRKPDGPPVEGYYPPAVSVKDYNLAQMAISPRRDISGSKPGMARTKVGSLINIFAGLLTDAKTGEGYMLRSGKQGRHYYSTLRSKSGRDQYRSVPRDVFDTAILQCLEEIDPRDILGGTSSSRLPELIAEREALRRRLADMEEELRTGRSSAVGLRVVASLEDDVAKLSGEIATEEQRHAKPLTRTWSEAQSLVSALPDEDARMRLRVALRQMVSTIMLLVVPSGLDRLIIAQVFFNGSDKRRDYAIFYRAGCRFRRRSWWCKSLALVSSTPLVDLRNRDSAARAEALLKALLEQLQAG